MYRIQMEKIKMIKIGKQNMKLSGFQVNQKIFLKCLPTL